jgi:hypothetical protein
MNVYIFQAIWILMGLVERVSEIPVNASKLRVVKLALCNYFGHPRAVDRNFIPPSTVLQYCPTCQDYVVRVATKEESNVFYDDFDE